LDYNAFSENFFLVFFIALLKPDFSNFFILNVIFFYFFSLFSTAYGYLVNDLSDVELDRIHGKSNVFHDISSSQQKYYVLSAFIFSIIFAIPFLHTRYFLGLWGIWFLLGTFYSLEPIRLKTKGFLNIFSIVLAQRILPVLLLFSALSFWDLPDILLILLYILLRGFSSDINHQLEDFPLDSNTGTATFVQKLGIQRSEKLFTITQEIEKLVLLGLLLYEFFKISLHYSDLILWVFVGILFIYLVAYFYGSYLIIKGRRQNPFIDNDKNIFQFLHHAFPSVILPVILCLLMMKFNFSYFFLLILIILNKQLYEPKIWSNSYPAILLKKLKLR
jgi:4-hydroxybenzoate polyprenyltransferase